MFSKLKEKLGNWTKKLTELVKTKPEEEKEEPKLEKFEIKKAKKEKKAKKTKPKQKEIEVEEQIEIEEPKEIWEPKKEKIEVEERITIKEPVSEPVKEETQGFFGKLFTKVQKVEISEEDFEVYAEELEMLLIENNVAVEVAEKIIKELKKRVVGQQFLKKEIEGQIKEIFKDIIEEILITPFDLIERIRLRIADDEPYIILFCGINGTGKTTTIAKIAEYLKNKRISCVLAAGDTFRAASIEQLKKHGEKLDIKVISKDYGSDPASVGFDAIQYAKSHKINCVLIDTAGRMHTAANLLREIEKISRICKPDLKLYIGESITGNDAVEQVKTFDKAIGIDGIILTKADIDEKGGTALSVGYVTQKPILFLGTGQEYNAIEVFDKEKFIEKLGLD